MTTIEDAELILWQIQFANEQVLLERQILYQRLLHCPCLN